MLAREIAEITLEPAFDVDWVDNYNKQGNDRIIVIGSGPAGMHFVDVLLAKIPHAQVALFGNEPQAPYNRVQLSSLLAGDVKREEINLPLPDADNHPFFRFYAAHICEIDRQTKVLRDSLGREYDYDILVLATGARAHVPSIPGNNQPGVFVFRSLSDAESLCARIVRSRNVVVVGGGVLGVEAAKALTRLGTQVTIVQQGPHLMNRQLDEKAGAMLKKEVQKLGIDVISGDSVREIIGHGRVKGVRTNSGHLLSCDTVVICAGTRVNHELALQAGLKINTGIVVDNTLQTSDPDIFAIGECCEHQGQTYGLANPGYEQAAIAADVICHGSAFYHGSSTMSRLNVIGQSVCSMGSVVERQKRPLQSELVFDDARKEIYRKVILEKGRVVGALGYGGWPESTRVHTSFQNHFYIWPWQRWRFKLTGNFWPESETEDLRQWPEKTVICQCKGLTKSELSQVIVKGANSLEAVQLACGASAICGSCKPLVNDLLEAERKRERQKPNSFLRVSIAIFACMTAVLFLVSQIQISDSSQTSGWFGSVLDSLKLSN